MSRRYIITDTSGRVYRRYGMHSGAPRLHAEEPVRPHADFRHITTAITLFDSASEARAAITGEMAYREAHPAHWAPESTRAWYAGLRLMPVYESRAGS